MNEFALNNLGAVALGVGDGVTTAMTGASGADAASTSALVTMLARPGTSVADVGTTLGITHSGAVRVVARLGAAGLVVRGPGKDGRTAGLGLSASGDVVAKRALRARQQFLHDLVAGIDEEDRSVLWRVLETLASGLARSLGEARHVCRLCAHEICRGSDCPVGRPFAPTVTTDETTGEEAPA